MGNHYRVRFVAPHALEDFLNEQAVDGWVLVETTPSVWKPGKEILDRGAKLLHETEVALLCVTLAQHFMDPQDEEELRQRHLEMAQVQAGPMLEAVQKWMDSQNPYKPG